jgi:hypothetical protein
MGLTWTQFLYGAAPFGTAIVVAAIHVWMWRL